MAAKKKNKAKLEPKWKTIERVVGMLESTLDPGAIVEHNVYLPDLATPGHTRQCDVVVTTGPLHRRTRTIVEVQRRGKKVEVAHFDGWVAKMRAIGAQHLICVSAVGYPSSVKDKAAQLGPTARLLTLQELKSDSSLLQGALGQISLRQVGTTDFPSVEVLVKDPALVRADAGKIIQHEPNFATASGEVVSLNQVAQRILDAHPAVANLSDGTHLLSFETSDALTFLRDRSFGPVRLRFSANVVVHNVKFLCDVLEYKQSTEDGALAWILVGETPRPGVDKMYEIKITFLPSNDGRLAPHAVNVVGLEPGDMFSFHSARHRIGPILIKEQK